jgi:hypothetical protein
VPLLTLPFEASWPTTRRSFLPGAAASCVPGSSKAMPPAWRSSKEGRLQGYGLATPLPQRLEDRAAVRRQRSGGRSALRALAAAGRAGEAVFLDLPEPILLPMRWRAGMA